MPDEKIGPQPVNPKISSDEAGLLWDEYKYRHDLIWRHLIRSTVAVFALVTVSYTTTFEKNRALFIIAALLALGYTIFSYVVLNSELALYENIKVLFRQRQLEIYRLHAERKSLTGTFSNRARLYLIGLFGLALLTALKHIWWGIT